MTIFSSLSNRIFVASAALAVLSIGIAIYNVNAAVTAQAENELRRGLEEAGTLIDENRRLLVEHFTREARLVADLPILKATVTTGDAPTVLKGAEVYHKQLAADLVLVTDRHGAVLAKSVSAGASGGAYDKLPGVDIAVTGREASLFWPHPGGMMQIVSVPIWIFTDPLHPEILGTLNVGFSLDNSAAARFSSLTNSQVAFALNGAIQASTLPAASWPALRPLLEPAGTTPHVLLGDDDYIARTIDLSHDGAAPADARPQPASFGDPRPAGGGVAVVLRSRTRHLEFLRPLHTRLFVIAVVAVLAATLISYGIARTVTRPLGVITATMREMAATGDLTRKIPVHSEARWGDEDARLLATTFNTMTDSIARFQRESAQRERLSSLGRLSTVVAHEIRNPLMIIKAALRGLRRDDVKPAELRAAVADIDEEIARLNRIVAEVLDFARPIKFELAPVDLNGLCEEAVRASATEPRPLPVVRRFDPLLPPIVTDGERLRLTLVNILTNARLAVTARGEPSPSPDPITVSTARAGDGRVRIEVSDRGAGIAREDLPRIFDPFFTTRRTGTGLGLAISRNIIEGLGGAIAVSSRPGEGTQVRIELPAGAS
jgi:signal transduction histidine kinase